jgi:hypothetical protein
LTQQERQAILHDAPPPIHLKDERDKSAIATNKVQYLASGLFMYSHWNLPVYKLYLLLSKFCGYNISARFKALDVGRRDENSPLIRSMHVEFSAKDKAKVQQFLEAYYNTQIPRTFMLGIKLRFIPLLHDAVGIGGHDKTMWLYNSRIQQDAAMVKYFLPRRCAY